MKTLTMVLSCCIFLFFGCVNYYHDLSEEISNPSLSDASITSFSLHPDDNSDFPNLDKEYSGNIIVNKNEILIIVPLDSGIKGSSLKPRFTTKGLIYVNGAIQTSGISEQVFDDDIVYQVVSANETNKKSYTVKILEINPRIFVRPNAAAGGDGSSWSSAFSGLHEAIETALLFHESMQKEIWIAAGTYKPSADDKDAFFQLAANTSYVGSFAGNETDINARNLAANKTIISGDLADGQSNNLFTSIVAAAVSRFLTFDGITFEKSAAAIKAFLAPTARLTILNCSFSGIQGTAVFSFNGRITTIRNSTFENITTSGNFGAVHIGAAESIISGLTFNNITGNALSIIGAGINILNTNFNNISGKQALFIDQIAESGAVNINNIKIDTVTGGRGVYISSHTLLLTKSEIKNCDAGEDFGGGIHLVNYGRSEISYTELQNTAAKVGGGIYYGGLASSSLLITNVSYNSEQILGQHPQMHLFGSNIEIEWITP